MDLMNSRHIQHRFCTTECADAEQLGVLQAAEGNPNPLKLKNFKAAPENLDVYYSNLKVQTYRIKRHAGRG